MLKPAPFFAAFLLLFLGAPADARLWTDASGKRTFNAEFIDSSQGEVWLKLDEGATVHMPLADLSPADRRHVTELLQREKDERKAAAPKDPAAIRYGQPRVIVKLSSTALAELSGMAPSRRQPGLFWAHNDSGDDARLYLFDRRGRDLGSYLVAGVEAFDWEDMASFTADGKHYLLAADTGNNGLNAAVHVLHVVEEPECDPERGVSQRELTVDQTIAFSFEDDYRNCEAVGIDPTDKTILLVSKERNNVCGVFALAWPKDKAAKSHTAKRIGTLKLRQATGMDVSPDGRRAIVVTYTDAFEYTRGEKEDWAAAFARPPRVIELPARKQGEAICYGPDGKTIYASSEGQSAPLIEVPLAD